MVPQLVINNQQPTIARRAFTLVELLVVIAIITILSTVGYITYTGAIERSRIGRAQADLEALKTAMNMYFQDVGELPPRGDSCSACAEPCSSTWTNAVNALMSNDGAGWNGPYLDKRIDTDPWGHYYCYDDNAGVCCGFESYLYSMGPDGSRGGTDNIRITVMRDNDW